MSGRRSFGSVRRKPNGKWEARYKDNRGEVHYRYFVTKNEADGHLAMMRSDMMQGSWLDPRLGKTTVEEWSKTFMDTHRNIRPTTKDLYKCLLRLHIVPTLGAIPLAMLTAADVESWMSRLNDNVRLSPSTELKCLRLLSGMMTLAVRQRRIPFNPCETVESPIVKTTEMMFLTERQLNSLADAMGERHAPWHTLVMLAGWGGLRWGECVGLPVRNVDPMRSRVRVAQQLHKDGRIDEPKTANSVRTVKLPKPLSEELAAACALREPAEGLTGEHADLVFLSRDGTAMTHSSTFNRRWWRPAVVEALPPHLHGLRFHDLRHTAVAIALNTASEAGRPLNGLELQKRMGHGTIQMTLGRYGHLMDDHDDEMVDAMSRSYAKHRQAESA